jgi:sugar phosphate permease
VTWLVDSLGYDLATAGFVFAVTQGTGIFGRVALGWISDRWGSGLRTLRWNALAMAATMTGFAFVDPSTSLLLVCLLGGLAGITVSSWNGVHLAEIARHAPAGRIGEAPGGATLVTFIGYVAGPIAFAALSVATGQYDSAFLAVAVAGLAAFVALAAGRKRPA